MGPLEAIGPYAETVITTRKSDVATTDNEHGVCDVLVALLLLPIMLSVVGFIVLYMWSHIGLICIVGPIILGFWACARYGTNRSTLDRFRYRTTRSRRSRIVRRLSDMKRIEKS